MNRSNVVVLLTVVLSLPAFAGAARAQYYPPIWSDLMTAGNANYYPLGSASPSNLTHTSLAGLPTPHVLTLPSNVTTLPHTGSYPWTCGSASLASSEPVTFLESDRASGITGVGFLGTFNDSLGPLRVSQPPYYLSGNMFESVFFNENQCYGANGVGGQDGPLANGREYGFFLATSDNSIWAYWGFRENVGGIQVQMQLNAASNQLGNGKCPVAGKEYYYEMYPGPASGTFTIKVFDWDNTVSPIYGANVPIDGNAFSVTNATDKVHPITNLWADPGFWNAIVSETGYVSANVHPAGVSGSVPASGLSLYLERIFAGTL